MTKKITLIIIMLKYIISKLTMSFKCRLFVDKVNGNYVNLYVDIFGNEFLAQNKYGYRLKKQ